MSDWHPIKTAPLTERILVFDGSVHVAKWSLWDWQFVSEHGLVGYNQPTHWMPLPTPPIDNPPEAGA